MMNRPELSKKSKYWIPRHRFYELKHFCLQYPSWKRNLEALADWPKTVPTSSVDICREQRPTEQIVLKRTFLQDRIKLVEDTAMRVDWVIGPYIIRGVTEGKSYDILVASYDIPCSKDTYYNFYRQFFWLLSEARG